MNYRDLPLGRVLFREADEREQVLFVSLLAAIIPVIPSLAASIFAGSVAYLALTLKTANEAAATYAAWRIAKKISRGGHGRYDYGMGKHENFARVITGILMLLSLVFLLLAAVYRFVRPASLLPEGILVAVIILIFSIGTNVWFWYDNKRIAVKDSSPLMDAQWRLFMMKAFGNGVVLVTMLLAFACAPFPWSVYIDPAGSLIITGLLLWSGYGMISASVPDLLDQTLDEELQLVVVRELADRFQVYEQLHGVRSRRSGGTVYIEIFLEFAGDKPMCEVQGEINRMKKSLEEKIPRSSVNIIPTCES